MPYIISGIIPYILHMVMIMCNYVILILHNIIWKFVVPITVSFVAYWLLKKSDENTRRRRYSILGVAIMESLLEEVNHGITIMKNRQRTLLPVKSWYGVKTVSNDVLLRIIAVSMNITKKGFPPREIRIHCKNYFEHMSVRWENAVKISQGDNGAIINNLVDNCNFVQAAEGVRDMLVQCKELLDNNAKKRFFPK